MKEAFPHALKTILHHEGGWADHPKDPGGATMKGVTLAVYREYLGRDVSKEELRNIPQEHLLNLYKTRYWDKARCDDLPAGVDLVVFDMAVNGGPGRAAKLLQIAVGATPDGAIGPKTLVMVNAEDPTELVKKFSDERRAFYKALPIYATFGKGWLRRVDEVEAEAIKMQVSKA
jgi:lysozyme family protein